MVLSYEKEMELLEFLKFEDWVSSREFEDNSWTVVARSIKKDNTRLFTFSLLAKAIAEEKYERILSKPDWETQGVEFGHPTFWRSGRSKRIFFNLGNVERINGITFEPFVFYRSFHGIHPSRFEVAQNFLLYHELYFVPDDSVYRKIDDVGEEHDAIIIEGTDDYKRIKVNTKFLRDYLAARRMILVRQHDHNRFSSQSLKPLWGDKRREEFNYADPSSYNYTVWVVNERLNTNKECFSRLLGKDIIKPLAKPDYSHLWFADEWKAKRRYCFFIIGMDSEGNHIEETCDEDELSNYFVDRGKAHFLTPVFFKREVLKKYYDNPAKYSVDARYLHCLDLWGLPIDINEKGLVYVWLGDFCHIPYKEQQHWRQYNVPPEGGITEHRWKTDFLAEFADPNEPVFLFQQAYYKALEHFQTAYGFDLFLELSPEDSHCFSTLHVPVNNEQKELDEQIQNLAKVLNDSLNKHFLDNTTDKSIDALESFLTEKFGSQKARDLVEPFRIVQNLRSYGAAHRKGKDYPKFIARYGLAGFSNQKKFIALLIKARTSLKMLAVI
jgi:hypothetical protein